jgi:site-specific DNA-methyltransferase (adenine-specific)
MLTSKTDEWETPRWLFDRLNEEFRFNLDPCASTKIAKCPTYYTKELDGLNRNWFGSVFVNPPHSRLKEWVRKAQEELKRCDRVVMLLPARTDTKWFHEIVLKSASEIRFIKGRLRFGNSKNTAPFPSMVVVFDEKVRSSPDSKCVGE